MARTRSVPTRLTTGTAQPLESPWKRTFTRRLLAWYRRSARDLPWRRTRDPYAIWISEIMLQQTQVATVIAYFNRFLAALPTVEALATTEESHVLRLWEGLGYYRRARNMHRAAQVLVADYGGRFPRELDAIRKLPGIGRYTAGAIRSIAFDLPAPILEANTARLLSRLIGFRGDAKGTVGQRLLWQTAEQILPTKHVGQLNSALMELGSQVCLPRQPRCAECPVRLQCRAYALGQQEQMPSAAGKIAFEQVREAAVIVSRGRQVLLRRCAPGERWAGLWDFIRFPLPDAQETDLEHVRAGTKAMSGLSLRELQPLATLKHGVTRYRITLECYRATTGSSRLPAQGQWRWVPIAELEQYPLSTTGRKLARQVARAASRRPLTTG